MKKFAKLLPLAATALPWLALAQTKTIVDTAETAQDVVDILIPIFMSVVFLYFLWGLAKYIGSAGDPEKAKEGNSIMIYGAIAIFVMSSIWGISAYIGRSIGVGTERNPIDGSEFQF